MAASATRGKRIGDVLVWEVDNGEHGYCRKTQSLTVEDDFAVGSLINASGAWVDGSSSAGSTVTGIVIDERVYDDADGANTRVVLYKGPAIVRKAALSFDGTTLAADTTAAVTALLALGIVAE